jgi:hypothetical protein
MVRASSVQVVNDAHPRVVHCLPLGDHHIDGLSRGGVAICLPPKFNRRGVTMVALAAVLIVAILIAAVVYGRALVYGYSDEYKMNQRIKQVIK